MIGAVAGDIIGSVYEFAPHKSTEFPLFQEDSRFTDDTVLTLATVFSLLTDGNYAENYRLFGRLYPLAGYGEKFKSWLESSSAEPYGSWGNGSAMRVAPIGLALDDEDEVLQEAARSAAVSHDHPEGIKGAQAVALGVLLARRGADPQTIRQELTDRFAYDLTRTAEGIRPAYGFEVSCQASVPEAIICFLEAEDWEQAVRLAVSLGGDADTQACIAGALAQARFGAIPVEVEQKARGYLSSHLNEILVEFENVHPQS